MHREGLETTLESLRQAGVYLSHDEFKGKKPVQRSGKQMRVDPGDFANPLVRGTLETSSSGSRSSGTVTRRSLEYQFYREAQEQIFLKEFDISKLTLVRLSSILPSSGGLRRALLYPRRGHTVDKWFALGGMLRDSWHYRMLTSFLILEARMLGIRTGFPTYLPANNFSQVARHLARLKAKGADCLFSASVSLAVRVAAAAAEESLDISGILFSVHGEALTDAKREVIEAAGASPYPGSHDFRAGQDRRTLPANEQREPCPHLPGLRGPHQLSSPGSPDPGRNRFADVHEPPPLCGDCPGQRRNG